MNKRILSQIILYLGGSLLLLGSGWYARVWYQNHFDRQDHRRVKLQGFKYTSPLLDVELPEGFNVRHEPIPFKYKIKQFVELQITSGRVRDMAVYYRDLFDGPWFGINEKVQYHPASMMKVPVMVAWLKRAEKNPAVLRKPILFAENSYFGPEQTIKPARTLTPGTWYTVDELLRYMVNYSDNRATWLLYSNLQAKELDDVLDSMDVTNDPRDGNNAITAHGYSGFFRILFNASYLNREMSEKALQLLSLQDFPQGLAAGIPNGVPLAAKFGEEVTAKETQLHEFGIVYHPNGPYILGVMTRGHDLAHQTEVIRVLSALVYNEVTAAATPR